MKRSKGKVRNVKIGDILNNPFRDFDIYPLSKEKIESLEKSFSESGDWAILSGRETTGGKIEIAFGHHRLEAMKRIYGPDYEIDIKIEELTDDEMIKRMSFENDESWDCPISATDDAVKAARDYLKSHPDKAREILTSGGTDFKRSRVGAPMIAKFVGKKLDAVQKSLERLHSIESGEIDKEALYKFPSSASADRFAKVVRKFNISREKQKAFAEKIVSEKRYGERSINEAALTFFPASLPTNKIPPEDANYCEAHLKEIVKLMNKLLWELNKFQAGFGTMTFFGGKTTSEDISIEAKSDFQRALNRLTEPIEKVGKMLDSDCGSDE